MPCAARSARRAELSHCRSFDLILTSSEADAVLLRPHRDGERVAVLPPWTRAAEYADVEREARRPGTLLFVGVMDRRPNVDAILYFHREVFPLLRVEAPEVRLFVVGACRLPVTLFMPAGHIGGSSVWPGAVPVGAALLTAPELRELARDGVTIGAHGWSHRRLCGAPADEVRQELGEARRLLGGNRGAARSHARVSLW